MTNFTPRPTIYKGVKMRSRLEAGFAMWLDQHDIEWEYEPHAFGSEAGQYLPDFKLKVIHPWTSVELQTGYVEVKPRPPDGIGALEDIVPLQNQGPTPKLDALGRQFAVALESEPSSPLLLAWPGMEWWGLPCFLRLYRMAEPGKYVFIPVGLLRSRQRLILGDPVWGRTEAPWPDNYWQVD